MVLVDTSVLIDYLRGKKNAKITLFDEIAAQGIPYGISPFTYMEVIQGAKDEKEFALLKEYVGSQTMYVLPQTVETFETAAKIYFTARRKGVTFRGTVDVLIALTATHFNLFLLHNDRDFDSIAAVMENLKILASLRDY
jgi:predicted nucleic acid-binding protein